MEWITQYGYVGLYVLLAAGMIGFPVPDETLMTFVGYLSSLGRFNLFYAWLSCLAGTMTGMSASYWIGRKLGAPFLEKYGRWLFITPQRLRKAEAWFQKYGIWTVSFGYFIPGIRHFTCYLSGISRVKFWKYFVFAGSGAFLWSAAFLSLGHFVGANWDKLLASIEKILPALIVVLLAVVLLAGYWIYRKRKPS